MGIKKGYRTLRALMQIMHAISELKKKSGKVYSIQKAKEDYVIFYRSGIYHNLKKDSFFDYLKESRTKVEIRNAMGYSDDKLLDQILYTFVLDGMLITENIEEEPAYKIPSHFPEILNEGEIPVSLADVGYAYKEYMKHLPERLKGTPIKFAIDFNVFNWVGGFRNIMYPTVTRGSLAYCRFLGKKVLRALKAGKKVSILDAGSGDGRNTMIIWDYFRKKGCFFSGADIEFHGIDYSKEFVKIANYETFGITRGVLKTTDKNFNRLSKAEQDQILYYYENFFPRFKAGDIENLAEIPDNYYDVIFSSNTLHWTNMRKSIPELLRITKPGGVIFGQGKQRVTNSLSTGGKRFKARKLDIIIDEYLQIIFNIVNPEATGHPYIDDFTKIAMDNGARSVEVGMVSVGFFFIVKRKK